MPSVTREMRVAFAWMRAQGKEFHQIDRRARECGCLVAQGWDTKLEEPAIRYALCDEHDPLAGALWEDYFSDEVSERFAEVSPVVVWMTLLEEHIAKA